MPDIVDWHSLVRDPTDLPEEGQVVVISVKYTGSRHLNHERDVHYVNGKFYHQNKEIDGKIICWATDVCPYKPVVPE